MYVSGKWWIGSALFFLLLAPGTLGWGKEGHYAICKIAEVSKIKGQNPSLYQDLDFEGM